MNRALQPQKMVRGLNFGSKKKDCTSNYLSSENKGTDQLCSYCAADLRHCFRIRKNKFSHDATQIMQAYTKLIIVMKLT